MEEINLQVITNSLLGIRSHVEKMIKREQEAIVNFEKAVTAHYNNELTEEDIMKIKDDYEKKAENDNKEIADIMENLKDKFRKMGLSEEDIDKQINGIK